MENNIRIDVLKGNLRKLRNKDSKYKLYGAISHRYESYIVDEKTLDAFEKQNNMPLPYELRTFLRRVGVGVGPGLGIFSLDEALGTLRKWEDILGIRAERTAIFQFGSNITQEMILARKEEIILEKKILQKLDGVLPICHYSGTHFVYIVLEGEEEGKIWTLNTDGFETAPLFKESAYFFLDWFENWLESSIGSDDQDNLSKFHVTYLEKLFNDNNEDIKEEKKLFFDKETFAKFYEIDLEDRIIEFLSLSDCSLNNLPDKIFQIKGLLGLDLSINNITDIYSSFKNMNKLKYLSIEHNNFKHIPETLKNLKELRILDASYNNIDSIPDFIALLLHLEYINLSNNRVKEIHPSIANLENLKKLDLSYNKGLFGLNSLTTLVNLEVLDLSGCELSVFSYYITMMKGLKKLLLFGNGFNKLPSEITNLQNLEVLTLNENIVENLAHTLDTVADLKNLKEIHIPYLDIFRTPKNIIKLKKVNKITLYPVIKNKCVSEDIPRVEDFLKRLKQALPQSIVELIY